MEAVDAAVFVRDIDACPNRAAGVIPEPYTLNPEPLTLNPKP
jgi:hypothetical protein